jgi:hypothetical protein
MNESEKHTEVAMRSEVPVWCPKCCLRIAPYAAQTVYRRNKYHENCFLKLVREEADTHKTSHGEVKIAQAARRKSA